MANKIKDFYTKAHLVVAAIRVISYQQATPPTIQAVCDLLSFSKEEGNFFCNKLEEAGIVEIVENVGATRLFIKNHLKIEDISRLKDQDPLNKDIREFKENQKGLEHKIKSIHAAQLEKQKNLFSELDNKLKKGLIGKIDK